MSIIAIEKCLTHHDDATEFETKNHFTISGLFHLFRSVNDSIYAIMVYALDARTKQKIVITIINMEIIDSIVANAFMHTM